MQETVERDLAGKTPSERLATLRKETAGLKSIRMLGREVLADGAVALAVTAEGEEKTENIKMILRKVGSEWKFASVIHP